jgi:hypothetical protein
MTHRIGLGLPILGDAFIAYSTFLFGHTVDYDIRASYPAKILGFGYGFLVLIAVAAYTANLAAFSTLAGVSGYMESMEQAIEANVVVCAPIALQRDLEKLWPQASFKYYVSQFDDMFGVLDSGACGLLLVSELDSRQSEDALNGFCARDMVVTKSVALETPIGFAVDTRYVAGLSFWMEQAEQSGITFASFEASTRSKPQCSLEVPDVEVDGLVSLTPTNFAFPFFVLFVCTAIAVAVHVLEDRRVRRKGKAEEEEEEELLLLKTNGSVNLGLSTMENETAETPGGWTSTLSMDSQPSSMWLKHGETSEAADSSIRQEVSKNKKENKAGLLGQNLGMGAIQEDQKSTTPEQSLISTPSIIPIVMGEPPQRRLSRSIPHSRRRHPSLG